ncbi:MAG: hypothetical protein ACKOC5_15970 [Chloroflexota bacterium]
MLLAMYQTRPYPALFEQSELSLTHAWLPRDKFDELIEQDGWVFARLGDGYLALLSENPYTWDEHPGEDRRRELIVPDRDNIWICELGRKAVDGRFAEFMERILQAEIEFDGSRVRYHSPSQGRLEFGWKSPLRRDGQELPLDGYPRYASPYGHAPFPMESFSIELGDQALRLDWAAGGDQPTRSATHTI